ncbi:NlpC/P60 family protein [Ligilactobacillus salivarius]|uniref:NlpC/P60 family protein n=1 Tax=Ligilactobacillus salivarius TaxID=1624 RepID=UPI0020232BF0|nr:NlpC/P60 family protein [Ligilactobacillus salivarius]URI13474.1 NlpC/P60 family protein [Ligilactobacillus salivarius]UUB35312.1 NlpC/P60 family protein [Ligilactobacillus salivarius]
MRYQIVAFKTGDYDAPSQLVYDPRANVHVQSATLNLKVNAIEDLTITVNKKSGLYNRGEPFKTHVNVYNLGNSNELVFRGRLIKVSRKMTSSGEFVQELVFESVIGYLLDTIAFPGMPEFDKPLTIKEFLAAITGFHNTAKGIDNKTEKISFGDNLGAIDNNLETDEGGKHKYEFDYKNCWDTIKEQLIDRLGGYFTIQVRPVPDEKRYVIVMGYSKMTEADHPNSEIKIGVNMQSAGVSVDPTKVVTRLIPLGATIDDKSETKQRYMLWSGKDNYRFEDGFVKSDELEKTFGIIYGTQVWEQVKDPNELRRLGQEWLARQIIVVNNWEIETFETDVITYYPGHRYQFVNNELAVSQLLRVVEKEVDITSPNNITLKIENTQSTLTEYQLEGLRMQGKVRELQTQSAKDQRRIDALLKQIQEMQRDSLVRQGSGQTVAGGPTEPVNGDWGPVIKHAARLMNVQVDDAGVELVKAQIRLESGGNEKALGGDDGLSDGRASGLLQFKPRTFAKYALKGYEDLWKGFNQLLAFWNIPNALSQISGTHGWSPSGNPRYSEIPNKVSDGAKKLQDTARKYLGVPYVWGGAGGARGGNPYSGMDCSSFVSQVYKDLGINIPAYTVDMESYGHQISRSEVQAGDMGFYGNHGASYHITLALDNKRMIYEPAPGQSCMEQDINAYPPTWWIRNDNMARIVAGG